MALSDSTRASASACWRPFSTMPARTSAIAPSWSTSASAEVARLLGLDVEDADDLVVPGQRHRQHRGDEPPLVDAAHPQEARVGLDVRDDQRLARRGDAAGDALAERHPRPADLEAVEPGRRRQRQVRSVAVQQVEGGDVRVERVAGPVDDRLEQLVPRPRGRGEAQDVVEEPEPVELVRVAGDRGRGTRRGGGAVTGSGRAGRRHRHHLTSVGKVAASKGCDAGKVANRCGPQGWAA